MDSFSSWANLVQADAALRLGPAAAATLAIWGTMKYARHPAALPVVLACIPLAFHAVLLLTGTSLQQAADHGWVMQGQVGPSFFSLEPVPSATSAWVAGTPPGGDHQLDAV